MAIFVAFAWVIEAAEWLGLIETEAQDPASRAYRLAHQAVALVKSELGGVPLEVLGESCVALLADKGITLFESRDGMIGRTLEGQTDPLLDLGPGGGIHFAADGARSLDVHIEARTEDGGSYDVRLTLPVKPLPAEQSGRGDAWVAQGPSRPVVLSNSS